MTSIYLRAALYVSTVEWGSALKYMLELQVNHRIVNVIKSAYQNMTERGLTLNFISIYFLNKERSETERWIEQLNIQEKSYKIGNNERISKTKNCKSEYLNKYRISQINDNKQKLDIVTADE